MQRIHQIVFIAAVVGLSWLGMMAVHELGHVVGARITGGHVERVVLHPLAISRTDVAPNPDPAVVVWLGPILGCVIPLVVWMLIPRRLGMARNLAMFFAGFCLIANGAYLSIGVFDRVGDCGEMLRTGSPAWLLMAFGMVTIPLGFLVWHRLGSLNNFLADPARIAARTTYAVLGLLVVLVVVEVALSWG